MPASLRVRISTYELEAGDLFSCLPFPSPIPVFSKFTFQINDQNGILWNQDLLVGGPRLKQIWKKLYKNSVFQASELKAKDWEKELELLFHETRKKKKVSLEKLWKWRVSGKPVHWTVGRWKAWWWGSRGGVEGTMWNGVYIKLMATLVQYKLLLCLSNGIFSKLDIAH